MPQLIYINDTYCATFEQLKSLLADDRNQKESGFRKEILSYYRDGILQEWLEALGKNEVKFSLTESTDNETFKSIVMSITGEEVKGDIMSKFNEVGEFLRLEYDGKTYEKSNETIKITNYKAKTIKFIFRCLKTENNIFKFTLNDNVKSVNWNDFNKNQEVVIEFEVVNEGEYSLIEGKSNQICKVGLSSKPPLPKNAVDLGLSVYWADRNVGANYPADLGNGTIKENEINKYIEKEFGKGWRLPKISECEELMAKCAIKRDKYDNSIVIQGNGRLIYFHENIYIHTNTLGRYISTRENGNFLIIEYKFMNVFSKAYVRPVLDK